MLITTFIGSVLVVYQGSHIPINTDFADHNKRDGDMAPWKYSPIAIGKGEGIYL